MEPAQIKGIPCFALVMCTAHLLRPLYFEILDPPLHVYMKCLCLQRIIKLYLITLSTFLLDGRITTTICSFRQKSEKRVLD